MIPFGVNSDPSFRAQKQRIRVRGCVFSYRRDSTRGNPWQLGWGGVGWVGLGWVGVGNSKLHKSMFIAPSGFLEFLDFFLSSSKWILKFKVLPFYVKQ